MFGDIEQMFLKISISPKDRVALRFLWRENRNEVVSDYKMNVDLLVKSESPGVADFALKKLVQIRKISYTHQSIHPLIKIFT